MKKLALAIAGLALIGNAAIAQTNAVLSRNAVGYIRQTTVKSNFFLVTNPFFDINGAPVTVTNLIGNQVPNGTIIIMWDPATQGYIFEQRNAGSWLPGTNVIRAGRGFWMKMATTLAHSNNYQVYLMGEVPDKTTAPTNTDTIMPGFNLIANPYPTSTPFTNLAAAKGGRNGDIGIMWDSSIQGYVFEQRNAGAWLPGTNVVLPGQGVWYRSTRITNVTWNTAKPYTWP